MAWLSMGVTNFIGVALALAPADFSKMEQFVKKELDVFLQSLTVEFDSSSIDDVVINYVMMILTDLIQDEQDEEGHHVEIDQLMELLVAYIPQINQIKRCSLNHWLLQLRDRYHLLKTDTTITNKTKSRKKKNLSTLVAESQVDPQTEHKEEDRAKRTVTTDTDVKDFVVSRYSYTADTQGKDHHPVLRNKEVKNMIRYRDNKVVSTKGERYTVETKKDQENDDMKKTYINLKPLRKYRFH